MFAETVRRPLLFLILLQVKTNLQLKMAVCCLLNKCTFMLFKLVLIAKRLKLYLIKGK